jgi:hypothetical protein
VHRIKVVREGKAWSSVADELCCCMDCGGLWWSSSFVHVARFGIRHELITRHIRLAINLTVEISECDKTGHAGSFVIAL